MIKVRVRQHYRNNGKGKVKVRSYTKRATKRWRKQTPNSSQQKKIFNEYYDKKISNVKIRNNMFCGNYDGHKLCYKFKSKKHVPHIGDWSHTDYDNTVFYDEDVRKDKVPGLLVHESVEQYLQKKKGLPYLKAHRLAEQAEKKYLKKIGQSFRGNLISYVKTPL